MIKEKKGTIIFAPFLVIMAFVLLAYAAVLFQIAKPITEQNIGEISVGLIAKYNDGEKYLLYLDKSSKYAAFDSVYELGMNGGAGENDKCKKVDGYIIWTKDCGPNKDNLMNYFEKNLKKYINSAYSVNELNYDYDFESNGNANTINGLSRKTLSLQVGNKIVKEEIAEEEKQPYSQIKEGAYKELINKYAEQNKIDPVVLKCMAWQESRFDPMAVSDAGAAGLMQLMPATAKENGIKKIFNNVVCGIKTKCGKTYAALLRNAKKEDDERFDPEKNIKAGSNYFKKMLNMFNGNVKLALAAYNTGPKRDCLTKNLASCSAETQKYVSEIDKCMQGKGNKITGNAINEGSEELITVGTYEINDSFSISFKYDFSDYERIHDAVGSKIDCFKDDYENCLKDELGMNWGVKKSNGADIIFIDVATKQKIERFNINEDDNVIVRFGVDLDKWEDKEQVKKL